MVTQEELIDFIEKVKVRKPNNPGQSYDVEDLIRNIPQTVELLFKVVYCNSHESLNRFDIDFFHHLASIVHITTFENIPISIEGLSQKYESFLKKIAYLKYKDKDPRYFYGDKHTKGINGTGLGRLCEGILDNTDRGNSEGLIPIVLPDRLLDYKGINRYFADYVRTELRNKVHYSKKYPRNEIILLSEIVVILYLITIQDNFQFLSNIFNNESRYINSVTEQFQKWQSRFVHIFGVEEGDQIIDNIDLDFIESDFDLSELEDNDDSEEDEEFRDRESGKISELLNSNRRLVIVGSPGMGKTTTMQFLCFQLAKLNDKIPVYLELRNFTEELDLIEELSRVIGIEENSFYDLLNSERLVILIDGVNEVIRKEAKVKLFHQVNYLLKLSDKFHFIASSRKSAYHNNFNLPIFQLQLMNDQQIIEFISKNYDSNYSNFLELLKKNARINEWARNPLMLTMLISVAKKTGGKIPDNTGKLLKAFIDGLYKREVKRNPIYNSEIAQILLSHLAFTSREDKLVGFKKAYALQVLGSKKNELGLTDDILGLLNSFIDINVLYENDEQIGFTHELYQEYFAAEELLTLYSIDSSVLVKYVEDNNWIEVIILFNGLVERSEAVRAIAKTNLLIAALAVNDTLVPNQNSVELILREAQIKLKEGGDLNTISNSIKSLISLGKFDELYLLLIQSESQNNELKLAVRKAISECYEMFSHNEMIDILEMVWCLFIDSDTELNFISAFFKNIPLNGLNELDNEHCELASRLTIKFLDYYIGKTLIRDSEISMHTFYKTYLVKPLIVIQQNKLGENVISNKVFKVVKILIGIGKVELAYPILKKFKLEKRVDLLKIVTKLVKKNSLEKAKLLATLFYDNDFAVDNKREKILRIALKESVGYIYETALQLTKENGYKEKLSDIIDERNIEMLKNKDDTAWFCYVPKQFHLNPDLSLEDNIKEFHVFFSSEQKLPMKKYIETFLSKYPNQISRFFKLLSNKVYIGIVIVKHDYGVFIKCPMFVNSKTVFAHSSQMQRPLENIHVEEEVSFQIIGYSYERQRINVKLCV